MLMMAIDLNLSDREKFEALYLTYRNMVYRYAYNILKANDLAEDAVQETFLRILKNLHKISDVNCSKTRNFLVTCVKRVAITIYNERSKAETKDLDDYSEILPADVQDGVWETVSQKLSQEQLVAVLRQLPEDYQALIVYKYAYGWSYKDISSLLNISEKNVSVKLHRAKSRLTKLILESEEEKSNEQIAGAGVP